MSKDRTRSKPSGLPIIHPFAAGIDIGSRFHVVAVSPDLCDEPVQTFQAFTGDLQRMAVSDQPTHPLLCNARSISDQLVGF